MTASGGASPDAKLSEPERLLRELQYMIDHWSRQASNEKRSSRMAMCIRKKERCIKMADQVRQSIERQREEL